MDPISQWYLFPITGRAMYSGNEQLKSMEAVGIKTERKRRNWNEGQGEMKRRRGKSPGREESPGETIGLDTQREREGENGGSV